jgi:hypothetical protein
MVILILVSLKIKCLMEKVCMNGPQDLNIKECIKTI